MNQRSEEWYKAKAGKVGSSELIDIVPGSRGAYKASRKKLLLTKAIERITGEYQHEFISGYQVERGVEYEDHARAIYEAETGNAVKQVGFIEHPVLPGFGASPDGVLYYKPRGLEIKIPESFTQVMRIIAEDIPYQYRLQCQGGMMVLDFGEWDFFSWDDRLKVIDIEYYLATLKWDEHLAAIIKKEVKLFNDECNRLVESILKKTKTHKVDNRVKSII